MNNIDKIKKSIRRINDLILEYNDRDLLVLSSLHDLLVLSSLYHEVNTLQNMISVTSSPAHSVIMLMQSALHSRLKKRSVPELREILTDGIDLIIKITNLIYASTDESKSPEDDLIAETSQFIDKFIPLIDDSKKMKYSNTNVINDKQNFNTLSENNEPYKIFIVEAEKRISLARNFFLALKNDPNSKEILNHLFRIFHTLKEECCFLQITSLEELAHNLEHLLALLKDEKILNSILIIDILFKGIDYANSMLDALKAEDITIYNQIKTDDYIHEVNSEINKMKISNGELIMSDYPKQSKECRSIPVEKYEF